MNDECYRFAAQVLGEKSPEIRETAIADLIRWLEEPAQKQINAHRGLMLLYFIRGAKFNYDKAKKKIRSYYRMRTDRIEWYANRNPFASEIAELLDLGVFLPLLTKDEELRQVIVIRVAVHDPKKHDQNNVFKTGNMILDYLIQKDETISVFGVRAIFDMTGVSLGHAKQLPPRLIKRAVESWENNPCRSRKLEFVNAPTYINVMLNIFRSVMSQKMRSRISVTGGKPASTVENEILPPELGGKGHSYAELATHWKQVVQDNVEWFKKDQEFKVIDDICLNSC